MNVKIRRINTKGIIYKSYYSEGIRYYDTLGVIVKGGFIYGFK